MSSNKSSIAILYICTGDYVCFWKDFYLSFEEKFIPSCQKDYYVFTDAENIFCEDNEHVHKIFQENLGWPGNTLFRYKIFLRQKDELLKYDYVFFMNANIICLSNIDEDFLPKKEGLLFVQHPGYFAVPNYLYSYDRNRKSKAYIPYFKGSIYICGGVNGGKSNEFMHMCECIDKNTDDDYSRGVIAKWHDESHINKYLLGVKDYKVLNPGYCYPEGWNIPFEKKLMVRDKNKYIDLKNIKASEGHIRKTPIIEKCIRFVYEVTQKIKSIIPGKVK